jgi:hypothetical protein
VQTLLFTQTSIHRFYKEFDLSLFPRPAKRISLQLFRRSKIFAVLPPESPDEPHGFKAIRADIDPSSNPERMDVVASAAQVRAIGSLGDLPLVVLNHRRNWNGFPDLPPDITVGLKQTRQELQIDLASLSSKSTHIIANEAVHNMQEDEPQLVIDAILEVMAEAKK